MKVMVQVIVVVLGIVSLFGFIGMIYPTSLHKKLGLTKRWYNFVIWMGSVVIAHPLLPKDQPKPEPKHVQTVAVHKEQAVKPKNYTKLTIDSVTVQNNKVVVQGSTDLPDGAEVYVSFDIPQKGSDLYLGSDVKVPVKSGHYQAVITPKPFKELQHGPYVIEVNFIANANNQSPAILKLVGEKGEHLKGPVAKKDDLGFMELVANKTVNLNLAIKPASSPTNDNFSPDHPVTASYLKQVLSFMDTFYHQLKEKENTAVNDENWSAFLASNNSKGWDFYQKINYQTNANKEDPYVFTARLDVAQAWVFLNALATDISYKIEGENASNESEDEKQYLEYYNEAIKEIESIH
jgi:hypothetical protein